MLLWRTSSCGGAESVLAAAAAARRLVGAYQELRQMGFLLRSLNAALKQPDAAEGEAASECSAAARSVVARDPGLLQAVRRAVIDVPPGQSASIVALVSELLPSWVGNEVSSCDALVLSVADLFVTCLGGERGG